MLFLYAITDKAGLRSPTRLVCDRRQGRLRIADKASAQAGGTQGRSFIIINLILVNVGAQAPSASLRSRNPPPLHVLPMKYTGVWAFIPSVSCWMWSFLVRLPTKSKF